MRLIFKTLGPCLSGAQKTRPQVECEALSELPSLLFTNSRDGSSDNEGNPFFFIGSIENGLDIIT